MPLRSSLDRQAWFAVLGLAVTQIVGWGTTYYLPSILVAAFRADLALSDELVFAGVTVMLLVSAAVAPWAGRFMERNGTRAAMLAGSGLMAAALLTLGLAGGAGAYAAGWVIIGLATPLALTQGALTALAQITGPQARRAIGMMMLFSGFSASVFWPLGAWLEGLMGWRGVCFAFAALHLLVCLPLEALILPRGRGAPPAGALDLPDAPTLPPAQAPAAFALAALTFSLAGFVSWGLPLHIIEMLKSLGQPAAIAVAVGALIGPAQVSARVAEMLVGQRYGILSVGLVSTALMPLAFALPLLIGMSTAVAVAFTVGYGLSAGAMTIVRAVAPLSLFGRERYAAMIGRLAVPQNIAFAVAPVAFAAMRGLGPVPTLWFALAVALAALVSMAALVRLEARVRGSGGVGA